MIPIVFSTDHNFVMPTSVAILSLLQCSPEVKYDIVVLCGNSVTEDDKKILDKIVSKYCSHISYILIDKQFEGAYEVRGITIATYYRLLLPWLLPQYDKVIYCDGDVIIKKNLSELYEFEINDNYVAGVKPCMHDPNNYLKDYTPLLGLNARDYVQAGILIFNTKKIREDNLMAALLDEAKKKYKYVDQDVINIVFKNKIAGIPLKYNVVTRDFWNMIDEDEICIIHYAGKKPWNVFTYYWYDWWKVYQSSPFYCRDKQHEIRVNTLYVMKEQIENKFVNNHNTKDLIILKINRNHPKLYRLLKIFHIA